MCKICEKFTQPRSFQPSIYRQIEFLNKKSTRVDYTYYQILLLLTPLKIK